MVEIGKLNPKFVWKCKKLRRAKIILGKSTIEGLSLLDIKTNHEAIEIMRN